MGLWILMLMFNVILYAFSYSQAKYFLVIPELYTYLFFAVIVFEDLHNLFKKNIKTNV